MQTRQRRGRFASVATAAMMVKDPSSMERVRALARAQQEEERKQRGPVDEGNRQLQQAVSRDSHGFRNLVVGLLLGASACLLFLDWYS